MGRNCRIQSNNRIGPVALYARAWVEMLDPDVEITIDFVALYARAWVEISMASKSISNSKVALYARAWVEIPRPHS